MYMPGSKNTTVDTLYSSFIEVNGTTETTLGRRREYEESSLVKRIAHKWLIRFKGVKLHCNCY